MSDAQPEMSNALREVCPGCEPQADWDRVVVSWCGWHLLDRRGVEDAKMQDNPEFDVNHDMDAVTNRAACALIHGRA